VKLLNRVILNISLAGTIALLIFAAYQNGLLRRLENAGLDFAFNLRGSLAANPHIVIIEITDDDIAKVGRWPWKRTWHAAITQALTDLGAKSIYFDIIFSESSDEQDDLVFEEALKRSKNVYLPFAFQSGEFDIQSAFVPIKRFASHIKGTGATNIWPDDDGIIRRIPILIPANKTIYPHIALKIALDYSEFTLQEIDPRYLRINRPGSQHFIPLDDNNRNAFLINWIGKWQRTF
jgi:CHASE2 domain-containing sensor protein